MRYAHYSDQEQSKYPICILVPTIRTDEILKAYIEPFGLNKDEVIILDLHAAPGKKKTPVAEIKAYINEELLPVFNDLGVEHVVVADSEYFKVLAKSPKAEANLGYVLDSPLGDFKTVYVPNYRQIFYDPPKIKAKIAQGIEALAADRAGTYVPPGSGIIQYADYPQTYQDIEAWLNKLLEMDCDLAIDIEAFSLKHHKAGIGTITFCWNESEGIAFPVDYQPIDGATEAPFGRQIVNLPVRRLLINFFTRFKRKAIYHNIAYDAYVLIYQLFMEHIIDTDGLLRGMDVMLENWDCTKLISYLATNSCAGNKLSLKDQAQEYSGNWAEEEIKDITKIPLPKLLQYNLVDGLSTWFVHRKNTPIMDREQQRDIYETLFQPASKDIIQMQLTGLPVNMERVREVKGIMEANQKKAMDLIQGSPLVQRFVYRLNEQWVAHKNATLKKKRVTLADAKETFNPNSGPQLQDLLYNMLGLPVISYTDSKQPSTDGDTLKALKNHTANDDIKMLLQALLDFSSVNKILTSFIPAMESAAEGPDGWHYLFGNFNLGGTVSGRLSSSDPNLQNLPSNSEYAKLIKYCIQAPPGWIFCGLDFNSLEDRISALTTRDPNKLKVYLDGYDGHSLRAFAYFGDQMPGIIDTVASINSIQELFADLRQESKAPTFALTYQGTYITLMKNCGFPKEKALLVEKRYHDLYVVSDQWVQDKLTQAGKDGYITAAFGLRVRTPLLHQVIRGNSRTPYEAEAEGRTAGNALGQSWCLLNSRASIEFMTRVRSEEYRTSIRPCAHIHDAQYYLVPDDLDAVMYLNKHLVKAVNWQEHPDIYHDEVKLGGKLSLFWPDWSSEIKVPNGATEDQIRGVIEKHVLAL